MACDLTLGRKEPCKDSLGGIKNVYFVDFGKLGTVSYDSTDTDVIDNLTGSSIGGTANSLTAFKYEVKGASSLEQTVTASRETGTTFYEQTLNITLKKLTKADHKELKLLAYGRPHIAVEDYNGNVMMMGLEHGADVSGGTIVTGTAMGDLSGYTLTFTASEKKPANFLELTELPTAVDYPFPVQDFPGLSGTITITEGTNT
tara:strand:+ start:549 stop:1154 length:606 start_codon:yes stop_codon:yes gene_type:complete